MLAPVNVLGDSSERAPACVSVITFSSGTWLGEEKSPKFNRLVELGLLALVIAAARGVELEKVGRARNPEGAASADVGVDHRRSDVSVPEEIRHRSQFATTT